MQGSTLIKAFTQLHSNPQGGLLINSEQSSSIGVLGLMGIGVLWNDKWKDSIGLQLRRVFDDFDLYIYSS